jgi:transposase
LDVHKDSIVACARIQGKGHAQRTVETFGTTTSELLRLGEWLDSHQVTHAAMEATGVYWKPVWHLLEGNIELVLANAAHIKNVPGRKTDVNDATWIADLLAHGLIRASFVPEGPIQELRGLTRTRKQLVRERARHLQRLQAVFEDANLKIGSVISDVDGTSGRAIVEALIAGETDPQKLLAVTTGRLRAPRVQLLEALRGKVTPYHRFLLKLHLDQLKALDEAVEAIDKQVGQLIQPFRRNVELLTTIPGVRQTTAEVLVSEIGYDMSRFPTSGHLVSWAGLCPRSDESAGKRRSVRIRKGAPWLKTMLVQAACSAAHTKDTYLRAQYHRIRSRRGTKKAYVAVAASILTAAYHMLRNGVAYRELGSGYFDKRDSTKTITRLVRRLRDLGCDVEIKTAAPCVS